jgi:ABC-2 type transport system permease protein
MAVYKKSYRPYEGALTPHWSRFLIIPRYAFEEMRRSRFLALFFMASFIFPLISLAIIYLMHNFAAIQAVGLEPPRFLSIGPRFFLTFLGVQSMLAFFFSAFVGPGLISPDLVNNAMPLYLSRPFSRAEYVLGKASVLLILLSLMTWIPGLLLFALQGYYEGFSWVSANIRIVYGLFFGAWIWISVLTLLALALSAWVKWKPVAGALIFGVFFVAAGFGAAINAMLHTNWGHIINVSHLVGSVWVALFEEPMRRGNGAVFFRVYPGEQIPIWTCWAALIGICFACLELLGRKIRGVEVAR